MRGTLLEILVIVAASTIIAVLVAVSGVAIAHPPTDVPGLNSSMAPGSDPRSGCQSRIGAMMCEHESS